MVSLLITAVRYFCNFLYALIMIRVILSWFPVSRNSKPMQILYALTEPLLAPIRQMLRNSPLGGPGMVLDISPLLAWMFIMLIQNIIVYILMRL